MNTSVVNLHLRREPRFYASIAGDRMYWQRRTNTATRNYNLLVGGSQRRILGYTRRFFIVSNNWQNIVTDTGWKNRHSGNFTTSNYVARFERTGNNPVIRLAEGVYDAGGGFGTSIWINRIAGCNDPLDKSAGTGRNLLVREAGKTFFKLPKVDTKSR